MNRPAWFGLACFMALAVCLKSSPGWADERPNILLILVDDLKPVLGCYGDSAARTPAIDQLAARGLRFDRAYCNQAVCAPSRFSLLLGSHPTSSGLYGLGNQLRRHWPDAVTLPQYFAKHGYHTESLGKVFHIGHGNQGDPASFNQPHFHDLVIEYCDPLRPDASQLTREEAYFTNQQLGRIRDLPRGMAWEQPDVPDEAYADGRVAREAARRLYAKAKLQAEERAPFFMAVGFVRPHLPFSAPLKYWQQFDPRHLPVAKNLSPPLGAPQIAGKTNGELANYQPVPESGEVAPPLARQLVHGYYASVSYVDAQIGVLLAALEDTGFHRNTIVVLWGDHGFHLGDHGWWTKHTNYEQANRIPLIVVAPGVTIPGTSTGHLSESVDLFPTLAELAGLPPPHPPQPLDGISLVPVLLDPQRELRNHAYHVFPRQKLGRAIRTDRYRLVAWQKVGAPDDTLELELYDYHQDPAEERNRADELPEVTVQLLAILQRYPAPVNPDAVPLRSR